MSHKPLSRQLSAKKSTRSPFSRSIYEVESPPYSNAPKIEITPERHGEYHDYGATKPKQRLHSNLNSKIDSIIKQNGCLIDENNRLIDVIREKDELLHGLEMKLQQQLEEEERGLLMIEDEKNRILLDIREELDAKDKEITQLRILLQEYEVREEAYKLSLAKLKEQLLKDCQSKIETMKEAQLYNIGIYQSQFTKLKQGLNSKQQQIQKQQHINTLKQQRYEEEIRALDSQLKYLEQQKRIEAEEGKLKHQTEISQLLRDRSEKRDIENRNYENIIKKIKAELSDKILENERLVTRLQMASSQNISEYMDITQQKAKAQCQMQELELRNRQSFLLEKSKLQQMAEAELNNLELCHQHLVASLKSQNNKLIQINDLKNQEIKRLKSQISHMKDQRTTFTESDNKLIQHLQKRFKQIEISHQQQIELFKVKIAQLHNGDLEALVSSYEQQIAGLSQMVTKLEEILKQNRQKLHNELVEKSEMRRSFEIELAKQSNHNIELKSKLEAKHIQMRESLENIRSKNQIASETALREKSTNKRDIEKREADIKKLYELIEAKDVQIQQLNDILDKLKKDFEEQLAEKNQQIQRLRSVNDSLDTEQRKQKEFYEKELKKKDSRHKDQKQQLEEELNNLKKKTYEDLMNQLHQVQKQKLRLEADLEKERLEKQSLEKGEQVHRELVEVIRLESSTALDKQREGNSKIMSSSEQGLKKLYSDQIKSKDKQITELKRMLLEKDRDIRDVQNKAVDFETRLHLMVEGQTKLRQLEIRTMNLGMDNNLIKSTAQLFKYKHL